MRLGGRLEVVDEAIVPLPADATHRDEKVSVASDRAARARVLGIEQNVALLVMDRSPVLHPFVESLARVDVREDSLARKHFLQLEGERPRYGGRAHARQAPLVRNAAITFVIGIQGQTLSHRRQIHDRLAEALAVSVLAAMVDHLLPQLVRIHDEVHAMFLRIMGSRRPLAGDREDKITDLFDVIGLMVAKAELDRLAAVEHRGATLGDVVAEKPQELVAQARIVAFDLVDRENEQVTGLQLAGRHVLRARGGEQFRIQICPAAVRTQGATHPLAPDGVNRMLERQVEAVPRAARRDLDEVATVAPSHDLRDFGFFTVGVQHGIVESDVADTAHLVAAAHLFPGWQTTFEVAHVRAIIGDDQRALELSRSSRR
jgi:hypothetical protein